MAEHSLQKKRNSANRIHLFKVLRRQTIDIIYFINVVPVSLLLVALSLSVPNRIKGNNNEGSVFLIFGDVAFHFSGSSVVDWY